MAAKKSTPENISLKNEHVLDQHFELAFNEILKIVRQLIKDVEKEPTLEKSKGFRSYSKTLKGFVQRSDTLKQGFRISVSVDSEFDKLSGS